MDTSLLILAAGMGSRYGGMKQVDAFGPSGETITDYSIYDAHKAGFNRFVFVISPKMEEDFKENYLKRFPSHFDVDYVIQSLQDVPAGFKVPADRVKPWGTAHAVLMGRQAIDTPFAVINADDYYGPSSYKIMHDYLSETREGETGRFCMVGFELHKTVSEHGSVARGVCKVDKDGFLEGMVERTKIYKKDGLIVFEEGEGALETLDPKTTVSMNLFGFTPDFFASIEESFKDFLPRNAGNPKAELFIPLVVDQLIQAGKAKLRVLRTPESWFGVTYQEDKPLVLKAIQDLVNAGVYPNQLYHL
ncbi:MAG: sugar phosphate nucleotidyltransferase [Bacteroidales bacterium]